MSADIAAIPLSVAIFNSYYTFHIFPFLILFQTGCFLTELNFLYACMTMDLPLFTSLLIPKDHFLAINVLYKWKTLL